MKTLLSAAISLSGLFTAVNTVFGQDLAFATNTLAVGNGPSSVIAADINNDGKVDLICTDSKDNTLTVLTNNGSGGFVSSATLNLAPYSNPTCVAAADVNNDGSLDLICALSGGVIEVLTNNGSGGFASNAVYNLGVMGTAMSCVVAADVNGDGKVDLITANELGGIRSQGVLTVLTNNGSGGFVLCTNLSTAGGPGSLPHWVAVADIYGNGGMALISANSGVSYNSLTVFTNDGSGDFGSNATYTVSREPYCVVAVDVNGDGKVDLVSANGLDNTLTVLTNNGSGVFGSNATYNVGAGPFFVTAADINGDGKPDLICANAATNTLTVLTNNGSGGFVLCTTLTVGSNPRSIAVADVNGDGKLDLISADFGQGNGNTLTVLTQVTPPPELTIASVSPDAVAVSWPSSATNFVLQTNADLTTTNWGISSYAISTNGQAESVTITSAPPVNLFFRLIQ